MRIAFILIYNNEQIEFKILGGFWKLPFKSIHEEGSLNERHINCGLFPYYARIDDETMYKVEHQLENTLPLLYKEMLEGN